MTTITQKKKLSKSAWVLVFLLIIGVVTVVVLGILGIIDLSPIGNGLMGFYMWASADIVNAGIVTVLLPIAGVFLYYIIQHYFVGQKVVTTAGIGSGGYSPTPTYPSSNPSQQDTETKIS